MTRMVRVFALALATTLASPLTSTAQHSRPSSTEVEGTRPTIEQMLEVLKSKIGASRVDPSFGDYDEMLAAEHRLDDALKVFGDAFKQHVFQKRDEYASRDFVFCRNAASPRLSGNVIRVGPDQPFKDLQEIKPVPKPGDLILLGEGVYHLFSYQQQFKYHDIAIVGQSPQRTTISLERSGYIGSAKRVLLDGVRIDCTENPLSDVRRDGGMHLRDCELVNYNSGAGGSNAIGDNSGVVLVEGCLFDGSGGRSSRDPSDMGNAMDLRADAWLYARGCQFVNNDEIIRATVPTVFDRCTALNTGGPLYGVISYPDGHIFLRESDSVITNNVRASGPPPRTFAAATDDLAFVQHLLDPAKPIDEDSKQLAAALQLSRRLPYWIGLIRHEQRPVRDLAAKRLATLVDVQVNLPAEQQSEGESLADLGVLFAVEQEYARLMNWFDANRDRLRWDETAGRYRFEGPSP